MPCRGQPFSSSMFPEGNNSNRMSRMATSRWSIRISAAIPDMSRPRSYSSRSCTCSLRVQRRSVPAYGSCSLAPESFAEVLVSIAGVLGLAGPSEDRAGGTRRSGRSNRRGGAGESTVSGASMPVDPAVGTLALGVDTGPSAAGEGFALSGGWTSSEAAR